jgi:hypothetical protein
MNILQGVALAVRSALLCLPSSLPALRFSAKRVADQDRLRHGAHRSARAEWQAGAAGSKTLGRGNQRQRWSARPAGEAQRLRRRARLLGSASRAREGEEVGQREKWALSVLQIFRSVVDDPVADCCPAAPARRPHHHHHLVRPRSPELHRSPEPESANNNPLKRNGDGAAGDLTIVRPAVAAPPRRPE